MLQPSVLVRRSRARYVINSFTRQTATNLSFYSFLVLLFPRCRGETCDSSICCWATAIGFFISLPVVGLFLPLLLFICLSRSLQTTIVAVVVPRFLQPPCFLLSPFMGNLLSFILTMVQPVSSGSFLSTFIVPLSFLGFSSDNRPILALVCLVFIVSTKLIPRLRHLRYEEQPKKCLTALDITKIKADEIVFLGY